MEKYSIEVANLNIENQEVRKPGCQKAIFFKHTKLLWYIQFQVVGWLCGIHSWSKICQLLWYIESILQKTVLSKLVLSCLSKYRS